MRVEIISDEIVGREGGFLAIRRLRVRNVHEDGRVSAPYLCDFIVRDKGLDAVVLAIYTRVGGKIRVLVRDGLRLPLHVGREGAPIADGRTYLFFREVVAGIVEHGDVGEEGVRARAALEAWEEAGVRVEAREVRLLGAGSFPSPGALAEKFWFAAVEVSSEEAATAHPPGDGSPMEEGAAVRWMGLDEAIEAGVRGEIEDMKTELVFRRLRDALGAGESG